MVTVWVQSARWATRRFTSPSDMCRYSSSLALRCWCVRNNHQFFKFNEKCWEHLRNTNYWFQLSSKASAEFSIGLKVVSSDHETENTERVTFRSDRTRLMRARLRAVRFDFWIRSPDDHFLYDMCSDSDSRQAVQSLQVRNTHTHTG